MAPRLKVFVTSDGLTDFAVAASSKAKALAAWGSHQDLFKSGLACETADPELVAAATARPGAVLRRPAGTLGELAKLKPAKKPAARPAPARPTPPRPGPSPATLKKVADLERRLAELEVAQSKALADLARERAALEQKSETLEADYAAKREKLDAALKAARRALG